MLARWIARGGLRRTGGRARPLPAMNVAHFGLALAGLAAWVGYLVTGLTAVAWIACVFLLPVAGLGMVLVSRWFPERSLTDAVVAAAPSVTPAPSVAASVVSGQRPALDLSGALVGATPALLGAAQKRGV